MGMLTFQVRIPTDLAHQIIGRIEPRVEDALDELTDKTLDYGRRLLSIPFPPASSPGEAPHRRSGQLQRSGGVMPAEKLHRELRFTAEWAIYLELGTSKMAPRPFMRPMAREAVKLVPGTFKKHLGGV